MRNWNARERPPKHVFERLAADVADEIAFTFYEDLQPFIQLNDSVWYFYKKNCMYVRVLSTFTEKNNAIG